VRPDRNPPRGRARRDGDAAGDAPPLGFHGGSDLRRSCPRSFAVPGVSSVEVVGHLVRCQVRGTVEPLLQVLAASGVQQLLSREPSLEELFLAQYGVNVEPEDTSANAG